MKVLNELDMAFVILIALVDHCFNGLFNYDRLRMSHPYRINQFLV